MPGDLNAHKTLFGGRLLAWIDEEAALYAMVQVENPNVVTKFISEIEFVSAAKQGDIIEIGIEATKFGKTSITMRCEVRNMMTKNTIITIETIVMVSLNHNGVPTPHGKTEIEFRKDREQQKP